MRGIDFRTARALVSTEEVLEQEPLYEATLELCRRLRELEPEQRRGTRSRPASWSGIAKIRIPVEP